MIGFLRGAVDSVSADFCFLDCNGVGYRVFIPESTRGKLVVGNVIKLFTYLQVREDAMLLFGFFSKEEYDLYILLLNVNGVGPKLALAVLSAIGPNEFRSAIAQQDLAVLTKISGVGKKTAERMIVELKDKVGVIAGIINREDQHFGDVLGTVESSDAAQALISLGYSRNEVSQVLRKLDLTLSTASLIKLALKEFMK
ncbi:MAG: Holliday junction branch migration protein RuvA [Negativicutes bacterium]|jgi:Holliday junction DNA helicase RuvA